MLAFHLIICEFMQMTAPCFFCLLEPIGALMNIISHLLTTATTPSSPQPFPLSLAGSVASALEERPLYYEEPLMSVWHGML